MYRKGRYFPVVLRGVPYILAPAAVTLLVGLLGKVYLVIPFFLVTLFTTSFFRNPNRQVPDEDNVIIAPADGKIVAVERVADAPLVEGETTKVSIFMSIFNVHVNRAPIDGTVVDICYERGRFMPAIREQASRQNEQNAVLLQSLEGYKMVFVQVAGILARRIVCYAHRGDRLQQGEICGAILFGSRVDIYLPPAAKLRVREGDRVRGGETVLGGFDED
jgi:phosphatidylserine decarboxylase